LEKLEKEMSSTIQVMIVEDNIVEEDDTTVIEDNIFEEDDNTNIDEDKESKANKVSKKSQDEIDYDIESYHENFTANINYTNQERISIFKSVFDSKLSNAKIGNIINPYFQVSSTRIG
jgi:hypothetical protein